MSDTIREQLTAEELNLIQETQRLTENLDRWFKKLDRESRENLFSIVKREDHIKTMKVKKIYTMSQMVREYERQGVGFHKHENVMLIVNSDKGHYNILIKDKFVIQLDTQINKIEVRLQDISTIYGCNVVYQPPYTISAKQIVEVIMSSL